MHTCTHIGINCSMLDQHPTGVGVFSYNMVNALHELYRGSNTKITAFTPAAEFLHPDIAVKHLSPYLLSSKYGKVAAAYRLYWNTLLYKSLGKSYDLVFSPTTHGSVSLTNQVLTIHDLLSLKYPNISAHQSWYFKNILPKLVSISKAIITVSEASKRDIISLLGCPPEKIHVVHNGFDERKFTRYPSTSSPKRAYVGYLNYVLAVGPTYPHKNFEVLLQAYANLPLSVRSNMPLVIVGGAKSYKQKLEQLSLQLGISDSVHFLGYVSVDLLPELYRQAKMLVFPSLDEGFGIPILEAMACGCPVISSNRASMPEVGGDAVLYFDPQDPGALQQLMLKLYQDEDLRASLSEKGAERAQHFSWKKSAQELKNILDHAVLSH